MIITFATELDIGTDNPTLGVKPYRITVGGYHTRSEDEIARFYHVHAQGTIARLAMTLMLYTGAVRVDAVALGWGNVKDGRISYRRSKTKRTSGLPVDLPVHPELATALDRLPRDAFTILRNAQGKSRSPNGLCNMVRRWCD